MSMDVVHWQYCKDPNDINDVIRDRDYDWDGLESAEQIISITWDTNHWCYVVFWKCKVKAGEVEE